MWNLRYPAQIREVNTPVYFTLNEFTERTLQAFRKCLERAHDMEQPLLPIIIQSDGGCALILSGFMSLMKSYREKGMRFAAVVAGTAASAGCCIFLYCDFRYMGEFSSLLFHSLQLFLTGAMPNVEAQFTWDKAENDRLFGALNKHLKKPRSWLQKQVEKNKVDDWQINAEEALELGMATNIALPEFVLTVRAEFSIN